MNEKDLMRMALSAYGLDRQQICQAARRKGAARLLKGDFTMRKHKLAVALAVALATGCLGGGVCAAGVLLSAGQAAEAVGEADVAALFEGDGAIAVNETLSDAGYDVTLLGLATGDHLTDTWSSGWTDGGPDNGTTYAVLAVQKSDGSPMPGLLDENDPFRLSDSYAQPRLAIPDLQPAEYWLNPERKDVVQDGVRYLLIGCDNVEIFADREVVLCVSTGSPFYNTEAFRFDTATGAITANPDYAGVNLVFDLPLDESKADPAAAQAFVEEWKSGGPEQAEPSTDAGQFAADVEQATAWCTATTPADVRAAGTLLNTETVGLTVSGENVEGYLGRGWYFGADGFIAEDAWPAGEKEILWQITSDGVTTTAELLTRNADGTLTCETWQLPAA